VSFDLIIANDITALPIAVRLAKANGAKVILDAHEYTPRDFDDIWAFRMFVQDYWDGICRTFLPMVDAMFTVCEGLAHEYHRNYGVPCDVLTNAPFFEDLRPTPVEQNHVRMIHHGGLHPSRRLEQMIYLMDALDERFTLDFMLIENDRAYMEKLQRISSPNRRIRFIQPVPMDQISRAIHPYDIGLFLLWPESFSYRMALPNKLFEFIQARLAVALWPSPEMAKVARQYDLGVVSEDFTVDSMARKLNAVQPDEIMRYKMNTDKAAPQLCAERNRDLLLQKVRDLIGE